MKKILLPLVVVASISLGWISRGTTLDPVLLKRAKQEYKQQLNRLANKRYLTIVDYRKSLLQDRLYVYDLQRQEVILSSRVSHAFRSGLLYPTKFSNVNGSEQSCYGNFITGEAYQGEWGYAMRLDGISSTNTNARARGVVVHPGFTWSAACYMTEPEVNERLINLIKGKSLVVVYK
jgi:hypothetical protein